MKEFNVFMLISRFAPAVGGTERQALMLSHQLKNAGVSVQVLTQRYKKSLPSQEEIHDVRVHRLPPVAYAPMARVWFISSVFRFLRHAFQTLRGATILHAHMISSPAVAAVLSARFLKTKVVVKVACSGAYGDVATSRQTAWGRWKLRYVLQGADRIVSLSSDIDRELVAEGLPVHKLVRIPNGVDTTLFKPIADSEQRQKLCRDLELPDTGTLILFSGRLTPQKRPDILIQAFSRIAANHPQTHLVILGDGPLKDTLRQSTEVRQLGTRVIFKGLQQRVQDFYAVSHIFVLPSEAEGMSNSLLEAMSSGLACIVYESGGAADIIPSSQTGFLYKEQSAETVAGYLDRLLTQPALAREMGSAARAAVLKTNPWDLVTRQYLKLYDDLL